MLAMYNVTVGISGSAKSPDINYCLIVAVKKVFFPDHE